ncbi:hypothetical protein FSARC_10445 [Fusarium sarcochroum]|uniref:Uncharacterized protein n=1 Tax=Fusarium sarcochroum TaxID=1208366 RepID=A0A8H4TMB8_9HYPO|nr:hypothetical protein FSARC_10445 [Fusarium sarcochroum]
MNCQIHNSREHLKLPRACLPATHDITLLANITRDRLLVLCDIPVHADKHEVGDFVAQQGFHDAVLYWPRRSVGEAFTHPHDGKCMIECISKDQAGDVMSKLSGILFQGSVLSTETTRYIDDTPQESVSQVSAPMASQPALPVEDPPAALASKNPSPTPSVMPTSSANATATESGLAASPSLSHRAAKADPVKILESLRKGETPDAYVVTKDWGPEDVKYAAIQVMKLEDEEAKSRGDMTFVPRVVMGKDGLERVRSYDIRWNMDDPSSKMKVYIHVTKFENGVRKIKSIIPDQLPMYEEDGWEEWFDNSKTMSDEEFAEYERKGAEELAFYYLINEH